jgi:hypothetical protein
MATLRNLAITILRLAGATSIAAALRHHSRRPHRPLMTLMTGQSMTLPEPWSCGQPEFDFLSVRQC